MSYGAGELTASGLVAEGQAAFSKEDFLKAEELFDQLLDDYGENPEVAGMVDEVRPLLALCKVKRGAFEEALGLIAKSLANPALPPSTRGELHFWQGICLLKTDDAAGAQHAFGSFYADTTHDRTRRFEAFLLFGTGFIQAGDFAAAAAFFSEQIPKLPADQKEVGDRARVLLLHSLIEAGDRGEALALVRASYTRLPEMTQVVSFQLLTLQLGAAFLEDGEWYSAIACLHRLWPRARLLEHQLARQTEWLSRRELMKREGTKNEALVFQIDGILARIARELEQFSGIESYDAARQLRLAQAFMGLQRWREAGALLESAVVELPPDKLLQNAARTGLASWQQIPRWDKVLEATNQYQQRFGIPDDSPEMPALQMARAEALHGLQLTEEAERQYGGLAHAFPRHKLAPRAFFMGGICQLELDRPEAAIVTFQKLRRRYPKSPLTADSLYWEGMALTFQKQWPAARKIFAQYLEKYPSGQNGPDAVFESARCLHNQFLHEAAVGGFTTFLTEYPEHQRSAEALLLTGESLMAIGRMNEGLEYLRRVPLSEVRLFEEAQFVIGEGLRRLDQPDAERAHFAKFIASRPRSFRLAEAVLHQGRAAARAGESEAARSLYWKTLEELGEDPANEGVEDLLLATRRLYPGSDGLALLIDKLEALHRASRSEGKKTLALRALWARGHLLRNDSPDLARVAFMQLGDLLDPARHHPRIIADCADARREAGAPRTARDLYEALRKWHPRAVEKERSSYGLGMLSLAEGHPGEALVWFTRCANETTGGTAGSDATIERAILLRDMGKLDDATALLEKLTTSRLTQHARRARALLELGRTALAAGHPDRAIRHFERCYLSGSKFREFAGEAWLEHGKVLESQQKETEAQAVYQGLLAKRDYANLPATSNARERLLTLLQKTAP